MRLNRLLAKMLKPMLLLLSFLRLFVANRQFNQSASSEKIKPRATPILRLRNSADGSTATQSQNGGNFMARTLISKRGAISIALAFLAAGTLLWIASARTIGNAAKDTAQWDEKSSKELMMALHHNHDVANTGDFKALKDSYIGDNALVTFELDP